MSYGAAQSAPSFPLISFVCETDADLLPHFVKWYRRLGVDRFLLAMLASLPGVKCAKWVNKPFCKSLECETITALTRRHVGEWVVFADADEFSRCRCRASQKWS